MRPTATRWRATAARTHAPATNIELAAPAAGGRHNRRRRRVRDSKQRVHRGAPLARELTDGAHHRRTDWRAANAPAAATRALLRIVVPTVDVRGAHQLIGLLDNFCDHAPCKALLVLDRLHRGEALGVLAPAVGLEPALDALREVPPAQVRHA